MKKLILFLLLVFVVYSAVIQPQVLWAQSDAGFLDSPAPINNPAAWVGSGWYCIEGFWPDAYIVAGPFSTWVDCDAY